MHNGSRIFVESCRGFVDVFKICSLVICKLGMYTCWWCSESKLGVVIDRSMDWQAVMGMLRAERSVDQWQRLTDDLVMSVLTLLPVPDLCRCRTVCKKWDFLISTPEFRQSWWKNARKLDCGYLVARVVVEQRGDQPQLYGWSMLDLERQRWYRVEYDGWGGGYERQGTYQSTDGGLVCECSWLHYDDPVISIFDPLMRERVMTLPRTPGHCSASSARGTMCLDVADAVNSSFKVYFIHQGFIHDRLRCGYYEREDPEHDLLHCVMPIFESTTGKWRSSSNPPLEMYHVGVGECSHSVMFRGRLHVLFVSHTLRPVRYYKLCRYDIGEDSWEDTGVNIQDLRIYDQHASSSKLIVSDGRLFLQSWMEVSDDPNSLESPSFCVYEILLADRAQAILVFAMTPREVKRDFHIPHAMFDLDGYYMLTLEYIQVFGYGKTLILRSDTTGIIRTHNLEDHSVGSLPTNPILDHIQYPKFRSWYGPQIMNLRLPIPYPPAVNIAEPGPSQILQCLNLFLCVLQFGNTWFRRVFPCCWISTQAEVDEEEVDQAELDRRDSTREAGEALLRDLDAFTSVDSRYAD